MIGYKRLLVYVCVLGVSCVAFLPVPFLDEWMPYYRRLEFFVGFFSPIGRFVVNFVVNFGFLFFMSGLVVGVVHVLKFRKLKFVFFHAFGTSLLSLVLCVLILLVFTQLVSFSAAAFDVLEFGEHGEVVRGGDGLVDLASPVMGEGEVLGEKSFWGRMLAVVQVDDRNIFSLMYKQNYFVLLVFLVCMAWANFSLNKGKTGSFYDFFFSSFHLLQRVFGVFYRNIALVCVPVFAYFFDFYREHLPGSESLVEFLLSYRVMRFVLGFFLCASVMFGLSLLLLQYRHFKRGIALYFESLCLSFVPYFGQVLVLRMLSHFSLFSERHKRALYVPLFAESASFHYGKFIASGVIFAIVLKFYLVDPLEYFAVVLLFAGVSSVLPLHFVGIQAGLCAFFLGEFVGVEHRAAGLFVVPLYILFLPAANFLNAAVLLLKNIFLCRSLKKHHVVVRDEVAVRGRSVVFSRYSYNLPLRFLSWNVYVLVAGCVVGICWIFYVQHQGLVESVRVESLREKSSIIKHVSRSLTSSLSENFASAEKALLSVVGAGTSKDYLRALAGVLERYSAVRFAEVTYANGTSLMLKRLPRGSFALLRASIQTHDVLELRRFEHSLMLEEDIILIQRRVDFRQDPCIVQRAKGPVYWLEPQWLPFEFQFGVLSCSVSGGLGSPVVVKLAFRLEDMSALLKRELPPRFETYVFDAESRVLASSFGNPLWKSYVSDGVAGYSLVGVSEMPYGSVLGLHDWYLKEKGGEAEGQVFEYQKDGVVGLVAGSAVASLPWNIAVVSLGEGSLGQMDWYISLLAAFLFLIALMYLIHLLFDKIDHSFQYIDAEIQQIKHLDFYSASPQNTLFAITEIDLIHKAFSDVKRILRVMKRYIPVSLLPHLTRLESSQVKLGGVKREIAILFSDIANFTTISENTSIEDLLRNLSIYFTYAEQIIHKTSGTIDKYIGDAIMAFWGAPDKVENHSYQACIAAIECQEKFSEIITNSALSIPFHTRIGIHTDSVIIGNIGSLNRLNYTSIGDGVNLASRIEGLNKVYGTSVMITDSVKQQVEGQFECRLLDRVAVKGKSQSIMVYQLLGPKGSYSLLRSELSVASVESFLALYEHALDLYFRASFHESILSFSKALQINPADSASQLLMARCHSLIENPPHDWNGVYYFHSK